MSTFHTEGQGNVPEQAVAVLPNRLDLPAMQELERALGGASRVAWLVEDSLRPAAEVMDYLRTTRAAGILCAVDRQSREDVAQRINTMLAHGRHVVFLPGDTAQLPATVSAVPARLLSYFDGVVPAALPVYAGGSNNALQQALDMGPAAEQRELRIMPAQRGGSGLGARVAAAWMEAAADALAQHPQLQQGTLITPLLDSLLAHPNARLADGVDDSTLTYRELLALALMFKKVLQKQTQHRRIGLLLPQGKSCTIAMIACILSGIVPVLFDYRAEEHVFREQCKLTGVTRFITEERFVRKLHRFAWPPSRDLIFVDSSLTAQGEGRLRLLRRLLQFYSHARIVKMADPARPTPETEAAVLFTAGAVGAPQAVALTHRMLLARLMQLQSRLAVTAKDSVLSSLPAYNMNGLLLGLLLPLLGGQDIITYPDPAAARRLVTLLKQYSVRLLPTTPAYLQKMPEHAEEDGFSTLRLCLCTGEKLPQDFARDMQRRFKLPLCECYGTVEAGLVSVNLPNLPEGDLPAIPAGKPGSAGAVLCGTAVRITDPYRTEQALPPSTPGLLWVRGTAVMKEYAANGPLSAERRHGAWFCTGDIARMDADGLLTIGGRCNRFSRIEGDMVAHDMLEQLLGKVLKVPAEQMKQHPICVVGLPDRARGERLYLLSTVHRTSHPHDLITMRYGIMNEGYPAAWTPEQILPVKHIPLLQDGRLDTPACIRLAQQLLAQPKR